MVLKKLPDLNTAVQHFLSGFGKLTHLPFLTDTEAGLLFGPEVAAAIAELDSYNRENQICGHCHYHCCQRVKCEFYNNGFDRCLVESFRPALCRLHFCDKYTPEQGPLIGVLGDIYLESLLAAAVIDKARANLFDCPAFKPLVPLLTAQINLVLDQIHKKIITETEASLQIAELIEQPGFINH